MSGNSREFTIETLPGAEGTNRAILKRFAQLRDGPAVRRTHFLAGRFENTYIDQALFPELGPVIDTALGHARSLLSFETLRFGFWFNEMPPGSSTTLHAHDEVDELLSCVYYIAAEPGAGQLILHTPSGTQRITPEAGKFVFFAPDIPHEVEANRTRKVRLSVAFNFGAGEAD